MCVWQAILTLNQQSSTLWLHRHTGTTTAAAITITITTTIHNGSIACAPEWIGGARADTRGGVRDDKARDGWAPRGTPVRTADAREDDREDRARDGGTPWGTPVRTGDAGGNAREDRGRDGGTLVGTPKTTRDESVRVGDREYISGILCSIHFQTLLVHGGCLMSQS